MPCYEIDGLKPVIHPTASCTDAVLIGDVIVGPRATRRRWSRRRSAASCWRGSNIQDTCVMAFQYRHGDGAWPVGHGAVLHGCQIGRNALVGMNAVIMDNAVVGEESIVAACAFVKAGMEIPPRKLAAGMPAKVVRDLSEQEVRWKSDGTRTYQELTERCLATLKPCEPLAEMEPGRKRFELPGVVPLVEAKKEGKA